MLWAISVLLTKSFLACFTANKKEILLFGKPVIYREWRIFQRIFVFSLISF